MKCPMNRYKSGMFGDCDPECAWRIDVRHRESVQHDFERIGETCAIAALASDASVKTRMVGKLVESEDKCK